jgi:MFS family permease
MIPCAGYSVRVNSTQFPRPYMTKASTDAMERGKLGRQAAPWTLPVLILAQFLGVSIWFSSSASLPSLAREWGLSATDGGLLVSAVQFGFIAGTLVFALTNLSDLFPATRVFLASALLGALCNALFGYAARGLTDALIYRFVTGLALAGIYPVGMKVVVSWSPTGIGNALGWLIGALTLGTASPFLLAWLGAELPWRAVIAVSSLLAVVSGVMVAGIGDGPHLGSATKLDPRMILSIFRIPGYRRAAFGYFGHMWELYAFWVMAPVLIAAGLAPLGMATPGAIGLGAFAVIGIGALGCVGGGMLSKRLGSRKVASISLAVSGSMCLLAPVLLGLHPLFYLAGLGVWGVFVVSDSAQFSALSAQSCPPEYVGTALTTMNSIGFAITIVSIEWTSRIVAGMGVHAAWILAPGPLLGLLLLNGIPGRQPAGEKSR